MDSSDKYLNGTVVNLTRRFGVSFEIKITVPLKLGHIDVVANASQI